MVEDGTRTGTDDGESDGEAGARYRQSRLVTDSEGGFDADRAQSESLPVEDGELVDTDGLADHQRYIEGRGVYDERNALNDLTGREWKYATKSVLAEGYPPDLQHDLRSEHGGQKPPRLCAELIGRFSKAGDRVLDPFAGVGGTLLGASLCEHEGTGLREAIGFERVERWVDLYGEVLARENADRRARGDPPLADQELRHGDCLDLVADLDREVDLLLTDVPYWDMDERDQTRNEAETRESKLGAFDRDVGEADDADDDPETAGGDSPAETKADWLAGMREAFSAFEDVLAPEGHAVVFIGDMYRGSSYEFLSAELAGAIGEGTDLVLAADLLWYDPSKDLHVYGYPYSFVPSLVHQHVLVFRAD